MSGVKMVAEVLEADRAVSNRWYVSNGEAAIGPVDLELVARGIEAGKVPIESFIRNEMWKVWRPLVDVVIRDEDDGTPSPALSSAGDEPGLREDASPAEMIASATDVKEALLLGMAALVRELTADAALVHELRGDRTVIVCAHGGDMFEGLGERVPLTDPALVVAMTGVVLVAEPVPGPAGAATLSRLARGGAISGAAMFPIRPRGRFFGLIEVGRKTPFRPRELAAADELVIALVARLEKASRSNRP